MPIHLPVTLAFRSGTALVVGGGSVGSRRALTLLEAGFKVELVSPEISLALSLSEHLASLIHVSESYSSSAIAGKSLVVAATDVREVNRQIGEDAREQSIPVNVVDAPEESTFLFPATLRRGNLLLSVTTVGESPALSSAIREVQYELGAVNRIPPPHLVISEPGNADEKEQDRCDAN